MKRSPPLKIAIIGAGFSGLAIAWNLLTQTSFPPLSVHLFDSSKIGGGTSGIAAGLLHPFSGAHAKLNWRGPEGISATTELLNIASNQLKSSVTASHEGILRPALNAQQKEDFQSCAMQHPRETQWLNENECQKMVPYAPVAPGLWIKNGIAVHSQLYLKGLWEACAVKGAQFHQKKINDLSELKAFDVQIIAAGHNSNDFEETTTIPLKKVKGQVLELNWPRDLEPLPCALNSQVYLLMNEANQSCLAGATFEKEFESIAPNQEIAEREILPKLALLYPPFQKTLILNCYAGVRASAPQHRPVASQLSQSSWVLTGMGSKGLLYHALFAKELVEEILRSSVLKNF